MEACCEREENKQPVSGKTCHVWQEWDNIQPVASAKKGNLQQARENRQPLARAGKGAACGNGDARKPNHVWFGFYNSMLLELITILDNVTRKQMHTTFNSHTKISRNVLFQRLLFVVNEDSLIVALLNFVVDTVFKLPNKSCNVVVFFLSGL